MSAFLNAKDELMGELKSVGKTLGDISAMVIMVRGIAVSSVMEIDKLDLVYDPGYGSQELYGTVLFNDGSWLEREEYDGSEDWILKVVPTIADIETQARRFRKMLAR